MASNIVSNINNLRAITPPESTGSGTTFSSDDPRPHFYIVRPDMTFVPLIAIDELNPMLRIHGVPPSLTIDDIEDWNMARVGDQVDRPKNYYRIEFSTGGDNKTNVMAKKDSHHSANRSKENGKEHTPRHGPKQQHAGGAHQSSVGEESVEESSTVRGNSAEGSRNGSPEAVENEKMTDQEDVQDAVDRMVRENKLAREDHPSKTKNAATPGFYGKKKFCTYWIRTGNCDYVQEGCKYLHVIPDEETRLRIGIRDMPRWAKEDIPAPQQDLFSKQHPAMSQDWRRGAPRSGRVDELPETSAALTRQNRPARSALSAPLPKRHANDFKIFQKQSPPVNAAGPAIQDHTGQATSQNRARSESARTSTSTSSAAESYKRQMQSQSIDAVSQPILFTPTSAAQRPSPPMQPPISRPTNLTYRAPDKMPAEDQRASTAQGQANVHGQTQLSQFASPWNPPSKPNSFAAFGSRNETGFSPANQLTNITPLSPLSSLANMSLTSGTQPPAGNGFRRFAHGFADGPPSPGPSSFESQRFQSSDSVPGYGPQQASSTIGSNAPHQNPYHQGANLLGGSPTNNSDAAKRTIKGHLYGNIHGPGKGNNTNKAVSQSDGVPGSPIKGPQTNNNTPIHDNTPTILHRRHFVGPGEPQYVAASGAAQDVEKAGEEVGKAEKAQGKKNGPGGGKKKPRG